MSELQTITPTYDTQMAQDHYTHNVDRLCWTLLLCVHILCI